MPELRVQEIRQKCDESAIDQLMRDNQGLVGMVLRRFQGKGYDWQELEQAANIGLFKAIRGYRPESGYAFSSYAVPTIIGEVRRLIRSDHLLHISRPIQENAMKLKRTRERLNREKGREPSMEELRAAVGISREELILAMEASGRVDSLDRSVSDDGEGRLLGDLLPDERNQTERLVERLALHQVLEQLGEEDRRLIRLRYMKEKTQIQTADILGTNQAAVSRREKKILSVLRKKLCL